MCFCVLAMSSALANKSAAASCLHGGSEGFIRQYSAKHTTDMKRSGMEVRAAHGRIARRRNGGARCSWREEAYTKNYINHHTGGNYERTDRL